MSAGYDWKRVFEPKTLKITANIFIVTVVALCIIAGGYSIFRFFFPQKRANVNNPKVVALPFSDIEKIDQTNTQISMDEKDWEVGVGAGGINFDSKNGGFAGVWVKRKW